MQCHLKDQRSQVSSLCLHPSPWFLELFNDSVHCRGRNMHISCSLSLRAIIFKQCCDFLVLLSFVSHKSQVGLVEFRFKFIKFEWDCVQSTGPGSAQGFPPGGFKHFRDFITHVLANWSTSADLFCSKPFVNDAFVLCQMIVQSSVDIFSLLYY